MIPSKIHYLVILCLLLVLILEGKGTSGHGLEGTVNGWTR